MKPSSLHHLRERLDALARRHLLRQRQEPWSGVSFSTNDYLGLAGRGVEPLIGGAGASRLTGGESSEHRRLEVVLAGWLEAEDALLFSSGYAANVGCLSALIERDDVVVSDALNHASIIDGLRLSRGNVIIAPHLDVAAVDRALAERCGQRAWVVTESYFSMDADTPDLVALRRLCDAHGAALIVDEAHALGVFGPDGRGLCAERGVVPDVLVGTLGKAFGAAGAFVAGTKDLVDWLWNRARSHVFSTGGSPAVAAAARRNIELARANPDWRARAIAHGDAFRSAVRKLGGDVHGHGPIVPWVFGREEAALAAGRCYAEHGMQVVAIRPPTVPEGTSRLRFTFTAAHTDADVRRAVEVAGIVSRETSRGARSLDNQRE